MKTMALPRMTMTPYQIGAILGLERLVQATGLVIICPTCLREGFGQLDTNNDPRAEEWRIDCRCRERRISTKRLSQSHDADGDLIAQADDLLRPLSLSVRCPQRSCLPYPLDIDRRDTTTIIRCHCAQTTLRLQPQTTH